jgi:hypothetical protein
MLGSPEEVISNLGILREVIGGASKEGWGGLQQALAASYTE